MVIYPHQRVDCHERRKEPLASAAQTFAPVPKSLTGERSSSDDFKSCFREGGLRSPTTPVDAPIPSVILAHAGSGACRNAPRLPAGGGAHISAGHRVAKYKNLTKGVGSSTVGTESRRLPPSPASQVPGRTGSAVYFFSSSFFSSRFSAACMEREGNVTLTRLRDGIQAAPILGHEFIRPWLTSLWASSSWSWCAEKRNSRALVQ